MSVNLIEKARASRIAATEYVAERKTNLVAFHEFRRTELAKQRAPVFGFVSSRKPGGDRTVAA